MQNCLPTEATFNTFVESCGGTLVSQLLQGPNLPSNADYLFRQQLVIAELKCLEKETFTDEYKRKLESLFDSWTNRRLILAFGKVQLSLRRLPQECQRQWLELVERPLQNNVIKKASRQIRATKEALRIPDAKGLLLVASDGNHCLQPHDVFTLARRILSKRDTNGVRQYSHIDAVVHFSLNMQVQAVGLNANAFFWLDGLRDPNDSLMNDFIRFLDTQWHSFLSELYGRQIPRINMRHESLEDIKFAPPNR